MKNTIIFFMILIFANMSNAQNNDYNAQWKKVQQFELDGLQKSALEIVNAIAVKAKKDGNNNQIIKSLIYKSKFVLLLEEDAQLNIISNFKTEIAVSKFPVTNILEGVLANLYWQYFQQNRYKFYNRTQTAEKVNKNDFRTWDLNTLFNEIQEHYQCSLEQSLMLQLEPLKNYDALLILQENSKTYRPTLYDFLAHNALEFYKTDENSINKPAYKFEIDQASYLSDATTFSQLNIASKDLTSLQLKALKLYQDLSRFHLKDNTPFALVNVDIDRLKFVKQRATFPNKDSLFQKALTTQSARYKTHEVSGLYDFESAQLLFQQGSTFQPITHETHRWQLKAAVELCDAVIQKFPKSKGAENCSMLKSKILAPSLQITSESFLPNEKDARLLIHYKNHESLQFKVLELNRNAYQNFKKIYNKKEQFTFINRLKTAKQWDSKLRNDNDYQIHSTEVLLPALSHGYYVILASPVDGTNNTFAYTTIQISDMALVERSSPHHQVYQLIDRNDGAPINNAKITLHYKQNNLTERTEYKTTNSRGEINVSKTKDRYWNLSIEVAHNDQKTYFDNYRIYGTYRERQDKEQYKGFVFTDRSIYRPGQTVFFKAIAIKTEDGKSNIIPNELFHIEINDPNYDEVTSLKLKSNEFGSVSGEFVIPDGRLNGQYNISFNSDSNHTNVNTEYYFSVEEYKRPMFEAQFTPISDSFKIHDSVIVKGNALAYAGSHITDAKVIYRVYRKVQYPRWYYRYRPWIEGESQEITHGETSTDASGNFEITFMALPDESVEKDHLPIFNYEIEAEITDINGETRSVTTIVNIGYHALTAQLGLDSKLDKTQKNHELTIDTKNLNGEFVAAKGRIKIYKLKAPQTTVRPRPWKAPDYQDFTEAQFKTLFPNEAYLNEDNPDNWKKDDLVFESNFNTETSKILQLGRIERWTSGQYSIVLETQDKFGQTVKDEIKTILFSPKDKVLSDQQLFSITTDKTSYKINDEAVITLASATNINVTINIEKDKKIVNSYVISLNNSKQTLKIPVTSADLGGFAIHYSFAVFNSFHAQTLAIKVPYPKTELDIETLSFRDKLQPGTDETWSFKIKGPKGEKVSAELLASMYDASLDQFKAHDWQFNPIYNQVYSTVFSSSAQQSFGKTNFRTHQNNSASTSFYGQKYDHFNWFGFNFGTNQNVRIRGYASAKMVADSEGEEEEAIIIENIAVPSAPPVDEKESTDFSGVSIRKNLQETAFFFPNLQTDKDGNVTFSFTSPEALTKWKLQLVAHSKTLESVTTSLETVTQKELMVIPNAPRFLRQGDRISISTKIANLSGKNLAGQAILQLYDALTGDAIDSQLDNSINQKSFEAIANGNTQVSWQLNIPDNIQAVQYKIIAKAGDFSDGEQNVLPVLSNRMLVTETLPMWIKSNETRTFTLDRLKINSSSTLKHHKLTLEMTSNPAWYAIQTLPYLMEYPYDCNEQTFSRFYANALASHIANSNPRIQDVFNQWRNSDALISNLEKNQDLKSVLIQETPWLRDAQSETEQKKRMALLFDLNKMNNELETAISKLKNNQSYSGAWPWFNGGSDNRFITQHIITGFGHLKKLGVTLSGAEETQSNMIKKAVNYLDQEFVKEYNDIKKYDANIDLNKDHLSYTQLHYLYMRSFFSDIKKSKEVEDIITYYHTQIKKYWLHRSLYAKGLMALVVYRLDDASTSAKILKSLKENSITSDELGMYWKANTNSWNWYQAPIETQALLIETFSEIENDTETIDNLKIWLLKHKQTNQWKTTKATSEAVYALLLQGSDWLSVTEMVDVIIGGHAITSSKLDNVKVEAGTGYYKTSWNATEIKPEMADVKLTKKGKGIAWGSLYWQYFEDLDKITSSETPLKLNKKLFLKSNTNTGEQISEITENTMLKVGDLVRVRIELRSDRNMEFIHMKDMRASGLEPVSVLSQYKWQDGLGYYESTKDASTNFFFDYLPKGVYVFEYDLRVNNAGEMSNGIASIQSMYAPEFSSHSEGVSISVKNKN